VAIGSDDQRPAADQRVLCHIGTNGAERVAASSLPLKAVVNFSAPTSTGSSSLTGYTSTCTAAGQTTQTATGISPPITVKNLKPGVTYSCKVVANNSYGSGLDSTTVQIKVRAVDLSAILSLLLDLQLNESAHMIYQSPTSAK
jgi:hypothetical protein